MILRWGEINEFYLIPPQNHIDGWNAQIAIITVGPQSFTKCYFAESL